MKDPYSQVEAMHKAFQIQYQGAPRALSEEEVKFRCMAMAEELFEYFDSVFAGENSFGHIARALDIVLSASNLKKNPDLAEQFDALLDLSVFTMGTAERQGFPFNLGFEAVMQANLQKRLGPNAKRGGFQNDMVKPPGWKAPNLEPILKLQALIRK